MSDTRSGIISAVYNELNLPQSVTFTGGEADYIYLSDGTKLAALKDREAETTVEAITMDLTQIFLRVFGLRGLM